MGTRVLVLGAISCRVLFPVRLVVLGFAFHFAYLSIYELAIPGMLCVFISAATLLPSGR